LDLKRVSIGRKTCALDIRKSGDALTTQSWSQFKLTYKTYYTSVGH